MTTTETLAGMHLTGRRVTGPCWDLIELEAEDGVLHTALQFAEKYRGEPVLTHSVELARSFMEFPMVTGLVELTHFGPSDGLFVYPTGNTRSLAEVIKYYRESKDTFSKRAAMELCFLAGQILQEASETGPVQGVYSHSDLNPSRILIREDGDVQIIGYGIPSPEVLAWLKGADAEPHPESLYYTPPERLQSSAEDVTSDLYSLTLIVLELLLEEPLVDGKVEAIKEAHLNGDGPQLLKKVQKTISKPVADILTYCLNFDPRNRYDDGNAFVEACDELLAGVKGGDTLEDAVQPVHARKVGRTLRNAPTDDQVTPPPGMRGAARGRSIRPPRAQAAQDPEAGGRWGKVRRGQQEEEEDADAPEDEEELSTSSRRRRRRRRRSTDDAETEDEAEATTSSRRRRRRSRKGDDEEQEEESTSRRRRRRRSRKNDDEEQEAPEAEDEDEEDSSSRRRRRRRSSSDDDEADAAAADDDEQAEDEEDEDTGSSRRRRRRRRRSSSDDEGADDDEADAEDEEDTGSTRRRRRRRAKGSSDDDSDDGEATKSRRRRRRRKGKDD